MSTTTGGPVEDPHALVGAYAVDALDDVARTAFERHLASCADCTGEVAGLREAAARLSLGVAVTPPPSLRAAVLARAATTAQLPPVSGRSGRASSRESGASTGGPVRRGAGWKRSLASVAVAASLLVGVGGLAVGWSGHREAERARDLAAADRAREQESSRRITQVLSDPQARTSRAAVAGGGTATLVVSRGGAVLLADRLAVLPSGRVYQLWLVRGTAAPVPGALSPPGSSAATGWARLVDGVRAGDAVALTVEPAAGSDAPTTTPVVAVPVSA